MVKLIALFIIKEFKGNFLILFGIFICVVGSVKNSVKYVVKIFKRIEIIKLFIVNTFF